MSKPSSLILTEIDQVLGNNRLFQRRLDLRLRQDISAVERSMAEQMKVQADDSTLDLVKAILAGGAEVPIVDHHAHINLIPELEL